jgi:O-antigen/teichoic acid export membrane protein
MTAVRDRAIRRFFITAVASKGSAMALQFMALPLAIGRVGADEFARYTIMGGFIGFFWMADLGLGNAVIRVFAREGREGSRRELLAWLYSGVALVAATLLVFWVLLALALMLGPARGLDLPGFVGCSRGWPELVGVCLVPSLAVFMSSFSRAQAGWQLHYVGNVFAAAGNLLALALLACLVTIVPVVRAADLVLAMFLPPALAQLANGACFVWRHGLWPERGAVGGREMVALLRDASVLLMPVVVTPVLVREVARWKIAAQGEPGMTGLFGTLMVLSIMATGVCALYVQPMLPAVADALARADTGWVQRRFGSACRWCILAGPVAVAAGWLVGPWLVGIYTRGEILAEPSTMALFAGLLGLTMWNSVGFAFIAPTSRMGTLAWYAALEVALVALGMSVLATVSVPAALVVMALARAPLAVCWPWWMSCEIAGRRGGAQAGAVACGLNAR